MAGIHKEAQRMIDDGAQTFLSDGDIQRYSRQLILKGWSIAKQRQLAACAVAVSAELPTAALYLAALGIGTLCLVRSAKDQAAAVRTALLHLRPDLILGDAKTSRSDGAILLAENQNSLSEYYCPCTVSINLRLGEIHLNGEAQLQLTQHLRVKSATALGNLAALLLQSHLCIPSGGVPLAEELR